MVLPGDTALPASARVQAMAELLAFGTDHLEDVSVVAAFGVLNGSHIALAQRWVTARERHAIVDTLVPAHLTVCDRFAAAPEVARISSLKRLTITCDIPALIALRTALAPPNGVLSRSLEALELVSPVPAWAPVAHATIKSYADVSPRVEANPWVVFGADTEATAAAEATGRVTFSQAVASLLCDGLRDNTTLTALAVSAYTLTDLVVTAGLMGLCLPSLCTALPADVWLKPYQRLRSRSRAATSPYGSLPANRTLRRVKFIGSALSAVCCPAIAQLMAGAEGHGLREVCVSGIKPALERGELESARSGV